MSVDERVEKVGGGGWGLKMSEKEKKDTKRKTYK